MTTPNTTDRMEEALKPCPFCGGKATDVHMSGSAWFIGADHAPDCHFADFQRSKADAIAAWNTRAENASLSASEAKGRQDGVREGMKRAAEIAKTGRGEGTFGSSGGLEYLQGYINGRARAAEDILSNIDEANQ